jgi:hypothetical protein
MSLGALKGEPFQCSPSSTLAAISSGISTGMDEEMSFKAYTQNRSNFVALCASLRRNDAGMVLLSIRKGVNEYYLFIPDQVNSCSAILFRVVGCPIFC